MVKAYIVAKSITLTLGYCLCAPLLSQPAGQQVVAVLEPVADAGVPNHILRSVMDALEGQIAKNAALRAVDRTVTEEVLSKTSYQSDGKIDRNAVIGIGAMLAANLVCVPEIRMDDRGFITITISLTNVSSRLATTYESHQVPRDNAVAINSNINNLAVRAFGTTGPLAQNSRQADRDRVAAERQDRIEVVQPERESQALERAARANRTEVENPRQERPTRQRNDSGTWQGFRFGTGLSYITATTKEDVDAVRAAIQIEQETAWRKSAVRSGDFLLTGQRIRTLSG
ncbi:MAG: hypothetical protein FWG12_07520 [Holophagaceae bacterium]|nr:hypothetical protein [Holophagaceae bacterium]